MTFGVKLLGHNNSLPISTVSASLVFRGKATRVTDSGASYYPADTGIDFYYISNFRGNYFYSETRAGSSGITRFYEQTTNSAYDRTYLWATFNISRDCGIFTYKIVCPSLPTVFCNTSNPSSKAGVLGILNVGTENGVPVWHVKVTVGFALGQSESTFLSYITIYCFSEVVASDTTSTHGLLAFDSSGRPVFSSDKKVLRIKDYVTYTGSTNPSNIADMTITRSFATNPEAGVFTLSKPCFMNVDFARYSYKEFAFRYYDAIDDYNQLSNVYLTQRIITSGISVNSDNNELDVSATVVAGDWSVEDAVTYPAGASSPPWPAQQANRITEKLEGFPAVIPIIDGADYD